MQNTLKFVVEKELQVVAQHVPERWLNMIQNLHLQTPDEFILVRQLRAMFIIGRIPCMHGDLKPQRPAENTQRTAEAVWKIKKLI